MSERKTKVSEFTITSRRGTRFQSIRLQYLQLHLVHQKPRQYGAVVGHEDLRQLRTPSVTLFVTGISGAKDTTQGCR